MIRLPLSLLDLLACSFGGVILLFFITITAIQDPEEEKRETSVNSAFAGQKAPFVLVFTAAEMEQKLFTSMENAFYNIDPPAEAAKTFITPTHAVFVFDGEPAPETVLTLNGIDTDHILGFVFQKSSQIQIEKTGIAGNVTFSIKKDLTP